MIVHSRIEGTHLAGNLLGDPTERDLFVYLPPGYEDSDGRYPAAYLLHAFGGTAERLVHPPTGETRWAPPIEDVLDPVFGRMGTPPVIVVIPDGWTRYGCSQWVDSPVCGNYEQYLLHDVVAYVDSHYRTISESPSRAVFGFSSGGFGAWHLASRNPGTFGAMAMLSGDSLFDLTNRTMVYDYLDSIWPEAPQGPIDGDELSQEVYAYSACYSPNLHKPPFYVDLPVAFPNGELIQEVWDRWLSFDPVVNWRDRLEGLRKLRGILLDSGRSDEHRLHWGHRLLSHHLSQAGIAHVANEHSGSHSGRSRERYQVTLRWLAQVLVRD